MSVELLMNKVPVAHHHLNLHQFLEHAVKGGGEEFDYALGAKVEHEHSDGVLYVKKDVLTMYEHKGQQFSRERARSQFYSQSNQAQQVGRITSTLKFIQYKGLKNKQLLIGILDTLRQHPKAEDTILRLRKTKEFLDRERRENFGNLTEDQRFEEEVRRLEE